MVLIWGSRHYGKVDEVPGLFHVATRFGHLWFIPLIPLQTHAIFGEPVGDTFQGLELPLSLKSVLVAWLRAAMIASTLICLGLSIAMFQDSALAGVACLVGAGASLGLIVGSYKWAPVCFASYERAMDIAYRGGMSERGIVALELLYGRISETEADRRMDQIEAEEDAPEEAPEPAQRDPHTGGRFGRR